MLTAEKIINFLGLRPHPDEGGFYLETYRSEGFIPVDALDGGYPEARNFSTCIYYLLTPETFSAMHRLKTDEIFHFYLGDPVEMLHLYPQGAGQVVIHGQDLSAGMQPQVLVPKGVWQGARLKGPDFKSAPTYGFALMGTTVAPGFEFTDYETGDRARLAAAYPDFTPQILALTR